MARNEGDVTRILADLHGAQRDEALNQLFPAVYAQLRAAARAHLRHERADHTLQAFRRTFVHDAP